MGRDKLPKIPLVPKLSENEEPIIESKAKIKEVMAPEKSLEEMTVAEAEAERKRLDSERRVAEFERHERLKKGKSESAIQREQYKEQVEGVEEKSDNITYPRDVIGRKIRKERVNYKFHLYALLLGCRY